MKIFPRLDCMAQAIIALLLIVAIGPYLYGQFNLTKNAKLVGGDLLPIFGRELFLINQQGERFGPFVTDLNGEFRIPGHIGLLHSDEFALARRTHSTGGNPTNTYLFSTRANCTVDLVDRNGRKYSDVGDSRITIGQQGVPLEGSRTIFKDVPAGLSANGRLLYINGAYCPRENIQRTWNGSEVHFRITVPDRPKN